MKKTFRDLYNELEEDRNSLRKEVLDKNGKIGFATEAGIKVFDYVLETIKRGYIIHEELDNE